jgi:hypothetical protein
MNVKLLMYICFFAAIIHALKAMSNARKYGRVSSSVDKNLFVYLMGQ